MTKSLGRAAVFVVVMTAFAFLISPCFADDDSLISRDIEAVKKDYRNFYANGENLLRLGIGVGVAGIFANSSMDKEIQKYYQDSVRSETTDSAAKALKWPGNACAFRRTPSRPVGSEISQGDNGWRACRFISSKDDWRIRSFRGRVEMATIKGF